MKTKFKTVFYVLLISVLVSGCTTVKQSVYLQNVEVGGPINQPPLHITSGLKAHTITVSPKVYVNTLKNYTGLTGGHTTVNSKGYYQVDTVFDNSGSPSYSESGTNLYEYNGKNLDWQLPDASVGLQVDIALTDHFAINGGINYAEINHNKLMNGSVGLGFFTEKEGSAVRFDFGLLFQNTYYDASSVVVTTYDPAFGPEKTLISFYRDYNKSTSTDFYGSLTFNSNNKNSIINYYFSLSYFGQTVLNYKPHDLETDIYPFSYVNTSTSEGDINTSFFSATPGIYTDISDWGRLSLGVGFLKELNIDNSSRSLFITPVVQFDMFF